MLQRRLSIILEGWEGMWLGCSGEVQSAVEYKETNLENNEIVL